MMEGAGKYLQEWKSKHINVHHHNMHHPCSLLIVQEALNKTGKLKRIKDKSKFI